jgi:hypothetical protein
MAWYHGLCFWGISPSANAAADLTGLASQITVSGKATSMATLATLSTDLCVKVGAIFVFVCGGSGNATGICSGHKFSLWFLFLF